MPKIPWGGLTVLGIKIGPKVLTTATKLVKGGKIFQIGSAGVSTLAWSLLLSWQFALLIMLLLIVHESGHVWAMKKVGMKTKGIYFVPFLGAAAVADDMFPSRRDEVFVAIMGPIWGLALSAIALGGWYAFGFPHLAAGAAWMATINLFNLLPINPLDGGRVFKSIAFSIHSWLGLGVLFLGLIGAILLTVFAGLWLFVIVFAVGSIELAFEWGAINQRRKHERIRMELIRGLEKIGVRNSPDFFQSLQPKFRLMPAMKMHGILGSITIYATVAGILYLIIRLVSGVPGIGDPVKLFS